MRGQTAHRRICVAAVAVLWLAAASRMASQPLPHPFDLSTLDGTNGVRIAGMDAGENSGDRVSAAGDVNGDGYGDILIGALRAAPGGMDQAGRAYLVYGSPTQHLSTGTLELSALNGANGLRFDGLAAVNLLGMGASGAGDVNGDGLADFIIGAPEANGSAGEIYLIYGSISQIGSNGALDLSTLDGTNGVLLTGIGPGADRAGSFVSGAGDVNGDGLADVLIGAHSRTLPDPVIFAAGESYLVYGSSSGIGSGGLLALSALDGANGVRLEGIAAEDNSGTGVSGAGDVNGDGYDDLLIGALEADPGGNVDAGEAYVVFGSGSGIGSGGILSLSALNGTDGVRLEGVDPGDGTGNITSGLGDVNGDALCDMVVSAPGTTVGNLESYLVFGSGAGIGAAGVLSLATLDGMTGVRIDGASYSYCVSEAGDVNGDGLADLLVGYPQGGAGEAYLVYGSTAGFGTGGAFSVTSVNGASGTRMDGLISGDRLGQFVSGIGDFNGDGISDFLVGAPYADPGGRPGAGVSYLIFGSGLTDSATYCSRIRGGNPPREAVGDEGDGSQTVPLSRVWADYSAGTACLTSVEFLRIPPSSFAPLAVSPEFEWIVTTDRTGYGTAAVTFKGLGVAGEMDWQGLLLKSDDNGVTWYAPASQAQDSLLHEITLPNQVFPGRYAMVLAADTATPEVIDAVLTDANDNGVADAGEVLTLIFDRGVIVRPAQLSQASFSLPVSGDSLGGAGFAVAGNTENSRFVDITLGASPTLTIPGAFGPTTPGSPSGIDIASGLLPTAIQSLVGRPAAPSSPRDIDFTLKTKSTLIPTSGGTATLTVSTDAAYNKHELVIPSGALTSPTTFTLQPPPVSGGQINAVQIVSSPGGVTFNTPTTLTLEYRDSDIDTERGQIESSMLIHQLVEAPLGNFHFDTVAGAQTVDLDDNTVSVDINDLNPEGSAGEVGIFAILPGETIERMIFHVRPEGTGAAGLLASDPGSVVLHVGASGYYTGHEIEIPGYEFTSPTDPARTTFTLRSPTLFERISTVGAESFPTQSASLFVVETVNASGQPVAFTDPVRVRVQFFDGSENAQNDLVGFASTSQPLSHMRLVHDTIDGPLVGFDFIADAGHAIGSAPGGGYVERGNITNLTSASGVGTWGAVGHPTLPVELSVFSQE
jgi:hypothetical protein